MLSYGRKLLGKNLKEEVHVKVNKREPSLKEAHHQESWISCHRNKSPKSLDFVASIDEKKKAYNEIHSLAIAYIREVEGDSL